MHFSLQSKSSPQIGFTLVEILIIAPVVILVISGFVALMVTMTADVLVTRDQNNMIYETQDALDQIEQDTRLSTQFLVTSGTFTAPQGSDSNFTGTAAFTNTSSTLILGSLTTDKNPADSSRQIVYYAGQPNLCGAQQSYNRVFLAKIVYFIKDGSLWRRSVLPNYNTNATLDDDTVCSVPWQRNTCSPGYSAATRCQTNDARLMDGVDSFSIKYFGSPGSTTEIGSAQALAATTIEVAINGKKVTAGRDVTSSGSIRATKLNNIDVDLPTPGTPTVSSQVVNGSSVAFSWAKVPLASSYIISYNINGGAWVNATTNSQTTTYDVAAELGNTVTIRVSARNSTGSSAYGEAVITVPYWTACSLQNNWQNNPWGFAPASYTKTSSGIVFLKGLVTAGNTGAFTPICTLPVGYRPFATLTFIVSTPGGSNGEGTAARINVDPNGEVQFMAGSNTWMSLDGIRFVSSSAPYTWTDRAPLLVNWQPWGSPYTTLQSTKDSLGRTHVRGLIRNGTYNDGTTIATFATGQPPPKYMHVPQISELGFNVSAFANNAIQAKGINPGGWYSVQGMFYSNTASPAWISLPLLSGWQSESAASSFPVAHYTKSPDGIVTLEGLIRNGTSSSGTVIAQLPVGYRPKERLLQTCAANGAYCRIDIRPDGYLEIRTANSGWTSLDSMSFVAEQ